MSQVREPVIVARIRRPWGRRGEVIVDLLTDWPEARFAEGTPLLLRFDDGRESQTTARAYTERSGQAMLALAGVESIDDAEEVRDAWVLAERDDAVLEAGEIHQADLPGLAVVLVDGRRVGTVREVMEGAASDLIVVDLEGGGEALVPLCEPITVAIDRERVVIEPPPGLLDLRGAIEG